MFINFLKNKPSCNQACRSIDVGFVWHWSCLVNLIIPAKLTVPISSRHKQPVQEYCAVENRLTAIWNCIENILIAIVFVLAATNVQSESKVDTSITHELSTTELENVIGGVATDVQWPPGAPWGQSYDNLRFQVGVTNHFGTNSATIAAYADNSKVGYEVVSTPGADHTGTLHRRFDWKFPGTKDLNLKYLFEGAYYNTNNEPTLPDQYLLSDVKVHTVKFWNASSPSMSTNVPGSISKPLLDNLAAAIPTRTTNVDGIYAENCPVGTKTQWRFAGTGNATLSDDCIDMFANGSSYGQCVDEFDDNYSNDPANVHVVWVKSNANSGAVGAHYTGNGGYMITLREDIANSPDLDAVLAHELGHIYAGGHTNIDSENDPCDLLARVDRNLMCSNVGRVMTTTQCTSARNSNLYQDRN